MPTELITPAQRQWGNRFVAFLGGASATNGNGEPPPGGVKHEDEDEENELEKEERKLYGEGLKSKSIAFDERILPPALADAVDTSKPVKMLSAAEWTTVARTPSEQEIKDFLAQKGTITTELGKWGAKADEQEKQSRIYFKLDKAITSGAVSCDLRPDSNETVLNAKFAEKKSDAANEYLAASAELKEISKHAAKCLPVLDAPENNPERAKVGESLKAMDELEKEFPTPRTTEKNKDYLKKKGKLLFQLQATIFDWNNRRTSQNIPPSSEAVAMADVMQRVYNEVLGEVIEKGLPMPLSDEVESSLSNEEKVALQESWKNLVASDTAGDSAGKRLVVKKPAIDGKLIKDAAGAKQFRVETLANLSRQMQSEAGRHLVDQLNNGKHKVDFKPGDSAACGTVDWNKARTKGDGAASTVYMVPGAKDSSVGLSTREGNALFAPRFIAMAHEMVHARHMVKGVERTNALLDVDPVKWAGVDNTKWNDMEEYQTIFKGSTSEQTMRQQYGLSAERFGHSSTTAKQPVADAMQEIVEVAEEMSKRDRALMIEELEKRKFANPEGFPDKLKIVLVDSDVQGPLPGGWDAAKLTLDQIRGIVGPPPIPAKLGELGWTPFGLTPVRIQEIIDNREHHERSAKGRRFKTLGGADALTKFDGLKTDTGLDFAKPTDAKWESKLTALENADKALTTLATTHVHDDIKKAAAGKGQVGRRIGRVQTAWKKLEGDFTALGGDAAVGEIDGYNSAFGKSLGKDATDLFTKLAALQAAEVELTSLKNSTTSDDVKNAIGAGTIGAQLKAVAGVWTTLKADLVKLGGDKGLAAIDDVNVLASTGLGKGTADLPTKVAAIRAAEAELTKLANTKNDLELKSIAAAKRPLDVKVDLFTKAHTRLAQAELSAQGQDTARQEVETKAGEIHTAFSGGEVTRIINDANAAKSRLKKVTDAMKSASELIGGLPGTFALLAPALAEVENEASAYLNHKDHQNPKTSDGKARVAECRTMLKAAQDAKQAIKEIAEKALAAVEFAEALAKKPDDFHESALTPLAGIHSNPYIAPNLRKRLGDAMLTARTDGTLKQQERANDLIA